MKHLRTLAEIARGLAPLLDASRASIFDVRFEGTSRCLTAWATNGHVLAQVVALGKFASEGTNLRILAGGASVLQAIDIGPDALIFRPDNQRLVTTADYARVMPKSRTSRGGPGVFMGPALRTMAEVVARFGAQVQFSVDDDPMNAMRVDSVPFTLSTLDEHLAWLSFAVMPSNLVGTGTRTVRAA